MKMLSFGFCGLFLPIFCSASELSMQKRIPSEREQKIDWNALGITPVVLEPIELSEEDPEPICRWLRWMFYDRVTTNKQRGKKIADLMIEYTFPRGEGIPYYVVGDTDHRKRFVRFPSIWLATSYIFGVTENGMPIVNQHAICDKSFGACCYWDLAKAGLKKPEYAWPEGNELFKLGGQRVFPHLTDLTVSMLIKLLSKSQMEVQQRGNTYRVENRPRSVLMEDGIRAFLVENRHRSLFCMMPRLGPRGFAQLLNNAALYIQHIRSQLPEKSFMEHNVKYGAALDDIVDGYPRYQKLLNRVMSDPYNDLITVFSERDKTLQVCIGECEAYNDTESDRYSIYTYL